MTVTILILLFVIENILLWIVLKHANKCGNFHDGAVHIIQPCLLLVCCQCKPYRRLTIQQLGGKKYYFPFIKLVLMRETQLLSANMTINQMYSNCIAIDYYCTLMKHLLYFIPLTAILTVYL